ncbi:MAG: ATP-dependent sacrificial sulfur transferase LarE [Armatimonadota bacterium]
MKTPGSDLEARERKARAILRELKGVLIALSGGVDSSVLASLAAEELGERAVAVTVLSAVYPRREIEAAKALARRLGLLHSLVRVDHLAEIPGFADNPENRCYVCKRHLFGRLRQMADEHGLIMVHGEQLDDLSADRPGHQAAEELGVRAPLAEAGLGKADVRALARRLGLSVAEAPAMACLATRFEYGTHLTEEALERVAAAEELLAQLGFSNYRARVHGSLVRVQVPPSEVPRLAAEDVRAKLVSEMHRLGFRYVTVDLEGYH